MSERTASPSMVEFSAPHSRPCHRRACLVNRARSSFVTFIGSRTFRASSRERERRGRQEGRAPASVVHDGNLCGTALCRSLPLAYAGVMYATAIVGGKVVRFKLSRALARAHRQNRRKNMADAKAAAADYLVLRSRLRREQPAAFNPVARADADEMADTRFSFPSRSGVHRRRSDR